MIFSSMKDSLTNLLPKKKMILMINLVEKTKQAGGFEFLSAFDEGKEHNSEAHHQEE